MEIFFVTSVQVRADDTKTMESQMMKSKGSVHLTWMKSYSAADLALNWSNKWRAKVRCKLGS